LDVEIKQDEMEGIVVVTGDTTDKEFKDAAWKF
jgi:hypothetical protein